MADSVDLVPDPHERSMPMPATPAHSLTVGGRCYCYYLFVVLTHHLWHFQSIPATPDPVTVRRAVKLKFEMQM